MAKGAVNVLISSQWSGDRAFRQAESAMRRFERDTKGLATSSQRAMARSSIKTAQWADKITASGDRMKSFGSSLTRNVTAPIAAIGALAVNEFRKYDEAMNQSLAIMDVDAKQKKRMEATAKRVASTTRVSLEDAAKSYFYLASAGLDAEQSIAALPAVARFSQAGMFDMSRATDLATDAQSALGLRYKNSEKNLKSLTRVTDVLTKANILSNASVEQFSEAMTTKAGGALKVANKSIEEGAAVLSSLADKGVKGAEAGDQLNQFLRDVPRAAVKAKDEWKKFGITIFDQQGNMRNSADVIAEFERVLGPMSDEQRAAALDAMKLNRGVAGVVRTLMGSSKAIRDYEKKLKDAGGATERVAKKQMFSFQAALDMLKNKFSIIATNVGPNLVKNGIMPIVDALGEAADEFNRLSPAMQGTVVKSILFAGALGPAITIAGHATTTIGGLTRAFALLQAKIAASSTAMALFGGSATAALSFVGSSLFTVGSLVNLQQKYSEKLEYSTRNAYNYRNSLKALAGAQDAAKSAQERLNGAKISDEQADINLERARIRLKETRSTRKSFGLNDRDSAEYRQAVLDERQAVNDLKQAKLDAKAADDEVNEALKVSANAHKKVRTESQKTHVALMNSVGDYITYGKHTMEGIAIGIHQNIKVPVHAMTDASKKIEDAYTTHFDQHSPSRRMVKLAGWTVAGLPIGYKAGTPEAVNAIKTTADKVWSAYKTRMSDIRSRSRDIRGTWGLFGAPEGDTKMTTMSAGVWGTGSGLIAGSSFTERLKSQNTALRKWTSALNKLKKMGASKGLMSALMAEGPSALAEVESLVSLGKSEVTRASALYGQNTILSKRLATTEVGGTTLNIGNIYVSGDGLTKKDVEKMLREAVREAMRKKK